MGRLAGKVIIVTGAARGVGCATAEAWRAERRPAVAARGMGRATAEACQAEGAQLVVTDRDPAVEELGLPAVVGDVADPALATQAVQLALDKYGAVHGLAHIAGAHLNGTIAEVTDEE